MVRDLLLSGCLFLMLLKTSICLEKHRDWKHRFNTLKFYIDLLILNDGRNYWTEPIPYHVYASSEKLSTALQKIEPHKRLEPLLSELRWLIPLSDYRVDDLFDQLNHLVRDMPSRDIHTLQTYLINTCPWPTRAILELEKLRYIRADKNSLNLPPGLIHCHPSCNISKLNFLSEWYRIHELPELAEHYCNELQRHKEPKSLACLYNEMDMAELRQLPLQDIYLELNLNYPARNSQDEPVSVLRFKLKTMLQNDPAPDLCEALIELSLRYSDNDSQPDLYQRFFEEFNRLSDTQWQLAIDCMQKHGHTALALQWANRNNP
ncbi:MAG: hypothetical protein H3C47_01430 [Candidatus Cloacimonetes bacterium]|nr:hypothetical protein [Candidatus Cloacimonadota bacterium]